MADEQVARIERDGAIAICVIDSPPVNALGQAVRQALVDAVAQANADAAVDALVIHCAGRTYFAGADVREFGKPPVPPHLPDVVNTIEASAKPVITVIHGSALGGGLEVAMGCHFRLATPAAKMGLPEVTLGIMPGAGGTQRLPRLIGVAKALEMTAHGAPIGAAEAKELGLVDAIVEGDPLQAALEFARKVVADGTQPRRTSERDDKLADAGNAALFDEFLAKNARKFRGLDAPAAIVALMRKTLTIPFAEAVRLEREGFLALREGPQSKALRHAFFAEREAAKVPGIGKDTPRLKIEKVAVIGAGTMGSGIALAFLQSGFEVILIEVAQAGLDRGVTTIDKTLAKNVAQGRMSEDKAARTRNALTPTLEFEKVAEADLVIEAVFELMEVKQDIFRKLDLHARPDAILATNTSYLDINEIASVTSRPQQVIGLHFFSPANIMKLLEVVRTDKTSDSVLASALDLAKAIRKVAVVARVCYGFIGNRMLSVRRVETEALLLAGASPYDLDRVVEGFGMAMGPCRIGDLAGLDLGWTPENSTGNTVKERLCEMDRRGMKNGAGFYDYVDGKPQESPAVLAMIDAFRAEKGVTPRSFGDEEILQHMLYPMMNEGAKILEEGIALRASDIDVVWLFGYGWPRWTGGPMFLADQIGLPAIVEALERMGPGHEPAALLRRLAAEGSSFVEYDKANGG
ncbi:MAG: 3-hydroxyacyl-CoA dehydrogenase NAD-binding domain-containing protein [Caenibius sp.]